MMVLTAGLRIFFAFIFLVSAAGRELPEGSLIVGYATSCKEIDPISSDPHIIQEAERGVNVVIWSFINLLKDTSTGKQTFDFGLNTTCIAAVARTLRNKGLKTTHLVSVGGWDAPHPDTSFSAQSWWGFFQEWNLKQVADASLGFEGFDGIDWDIEGVNELTSPDNVITPACIRLVGELSQTAKKNGYIVTMVPPQSYLNPAVLDVDLNLRHSSPCAPTFRYAGQNAYAALLAKYGSDTFDLISVQLYESWSYINCQIRSSQNPSEALRLFINTYENGAMMNFSSISEELKIPALHRIYVQPRKLLVGFSFGMGAGKSIYIPPSRLSDALLGTTESCGMPKERWPRGVFFWDMELDADRPVNGSDLTVSFAAGFNNIFHVR